MGKIIGRMGNTAKAIRTLLRIIGMKNNARVNLKINEPEGGQREYTAPQQDSTGSMGHANSEALRSTPNSFKTVDQAMEALKGIKKIPFGGFLVSYKYAFS